MAPRQLELRGNTTVELRDTTYELRLVRGDQLAVVLPLFHDAFGRTFSQSWLERKYASSEGGVDSVLCVAFAADGSAAGSVGMLPSRFSYGDKEELAGQMVDVTTGSAHRGRGLFVHLADTVASLCADAGFGFLFGFPNPEAYPIWINKLGYRHLDDLTEYRRPVQTLWIERIARRAKLGTPYMAYVDALLRRRTAHHTLPNSLAVEGAACTVRDENLFDYKARFAGSRVVEVSGGRVWLNAHHGLLIGDVEAQTRADCERTVQDLTRIARRLGLHQMVFQASRGARFADRLTGLLDASPGLPIIYRPLTTTIPPERLRFSFGDLDNF